MGEIDCLRLAARQHGLVRREQALELGLSPDQIKGRVGSGRWTAVLPSVYRVEGSPKSWEQRLKAASLWARLGYALSHGTAATLWEVPKFPCASVEISVTRHLDPVEGVEVHRVHELPPSDIGSVNGLRVTTPTRTLVDLSKIESEPVIRAVLDEFLRRRRTTLERLGQVLDRSRHHPGLEILRRLVRSYEGGEAYTESELEQQVWDLIDSEGLPRPEKQRSLVVGGALRRLDFLYPRERVVIEAESFYWHTRPDAFEKDGARRNALMVRGYFPLVWTWRALRESPRSLLADLRSMLERGARLAAG